MIARRWVLYAWVSLVAGCSSDGTAADSGAGDAFAPTVDAAGEADARFPGCEALSALPLDIDLQAGALLAPSVECSYAADGTAMDHGVLDLTLSRRYLVAVAFHNVGDEAYYLSRLVVVHASERTCDAPRGAVLDISLALPAMGSDVAIATGIADTLGATLSQGWLELSIVAEGTSATGTEISTKERSYPIELCEGCLRNVRGPCGAVSPPFEVPCFPGQDAPIDCCTESDGSLRCPP